MLDVQIKRGYEKPYKARLDMIQIYSRSGTRVLLGTTERNKKPSLRKKIHLQNTPLAGGDLLDFHAAMLIFEGLGYTLYEN